MAPLNKSRSTSKSQKRVEASENTISFKKALGGGKEIKGMRYPCIALNTVESVVTFDHWAMQLPKRPAVLTLFSDGDETEIGTGNVGRGGSVKQELLIGEPVVGEQEPSSFPKVSASTMRAVF